MFDKLNVQMKDNKPCIQPVGETNSDDIEMSNIASFQSAYGLESPSSGVSMNNYEKKSEDQS
ncbi:MAG: hypothetical protein ACMG6E_06785 [Candidatus Roizmanbacteria bacterium]